MNRNERRGMAKKGIDGKQLKQIIEHNTVTGFDEGYALGYKDGFEEGSKKAITNSVESFSVAMLYVMTRKLGYGEKKCQLTMRQIADIFNELYEGRMDFDSTKEEVQRRSGVTLVNEPGQP